MKLETCHECGEDFKSVGAHWAISSCDYPRITPRQEEILIGNLMGDGTINRGSTNPAFQVKMIKKEYLEYLHNVFGIMSRGVTKARTAEECALENKQRSFTTAVHEEKYSDQYIWSTRTHPLFNGFSYWYRSGEKIFPDDIFLSPTVLRHWFVCDGSYQKVNSQIQISMANEIENKQKIENYFEKVDLPTPNNWVEYKNSTGITACTACWNKDESNKLFEYMRYSIPGFKYKFPESYPSIGDVES